MITYEVTLDVEPQLVDKVVQYMQDKHIPELWETGCFFHIVFGRAGPNRFRTCYHVRGQDELERYMNQFAAKLRDDFAAHFPAGVKPSRETWHQLRIWGQAAVRD
jgi:hypothetical protein